ncbi:MAG: orotidine-5'-phosphate decarboxylase [Actinobacteria bacterium]|nr:orotidine-5'-phosphate decarboxylase [Actinomycetota bacterium]
MNPLCVALDAREPRLNVQLARAAAAHVGYVKIGLTAFTSGGRSLAEELGGIRPLFVDLKLHDIPAQVESAIENISAMGASLTTVHAGGGADMVKAAVAGAADDMKVIAVTVLTSLDDGALETVGMRGPASDAVVRLADMALGAGADGLVCSPLEVAAVREHFGDEPFLVVPGIRPEDRGDDQRRTLGPRDALDAGASLLVIGRPITKAEDPARAARSIYESLT